MMQTVRENKKLKVFIQANCQSHALRAIFQRVERLNNQYEIIDVKPVHLWQEEDFTEIVEKVKACDVFLHQPIFKQHFGKFASDNLKRYLKNGAKAISFPNLYFTGYHPQAFYLKDASGKKVSEPFDYHDKNIVEFYKQGLKEKEILEKIQDESFYSVDEIAENIAESLKALRDREKHTDIKISDYIEKNMIGKKLFHIFNHPNNEMIFCLFDSILTLLDESKLDDNEKALFKKEMLGQVRYPVYPSVQKYFEISEALILENYGDSYPVKEWVDLFLSFYKLNPLKNPKNPSYFKYYNTYSKNNGNPYKNYIRYDRRNPSVDNSKIGEEVGLISYIDKFREQYKSLENIKYRDHGIYKVPEIQYDQIEYCEVAERFCLSNTFDYYNMVVFFDNIEIIMPSGTAYIPSENSLIDETNFMSLLCFHPDFTNDKSTNWKWRKNNTYKCRKNKIKGSIGWCYHRFYNQYFHWFIDCLPRLYLLEKANIKPDWYFFGDIINIPFAIESLEVFGIDISKCLILKNDITTNFNNIYIPMSKLIENRKMRPALGDGVHYKGGWDPKYLKYLNNKFVSWAKKKSIRSGSKKIFIDRKDAGHRQIKNYKEINSILDDYGFERINPSEYSFLDQVKIFSDADIIVGIHGAGLTNILWVDIDRKPKVLEIVVGKLGDPGYRMICAGLGIDYYVIDSQACGNHKSGIAFDDIHVNTTVFENALKQNFGIFKKDMP